MSTSQAGSGAPARRSGPGGSLRQASGRLRASSLNVRLALLSGALTAVVVSAAFAALRFGIRARTQAVLADELAVHQQTLIATERRTLAELLTTSLLIGDSPALQAALETYRMESATRAAFRGQALRTIREETNRIAGFLAPDLLVVTDSQGRVLVASGLRG